MEDALLPERKNPLMMNGSLLTGADNPALEPATTQFSPAIDHYDQALDDYTDEEDGGDVVGGRLSFGRYDDDDDDDDEFGEEGSKASVGATHEEQSNASVGKDSREDDFKGLEEDS